MNLPTPHPPNLTLQDIIHWPVKNIQKQTVVDNVPLPEYVVSKLAKPKNVKNRFVFDNLIVCHEGEGGNWLNMTPPPFRFLAFIFPYTPLLLLVMLSFSSELSI